MIYRGGVERKEELQRMIGKEKLKIEKIDLENMDH